MQQWEGPEDEARGNGDLICKHDALRDVLYTVTRSAALAPKKEMLSLIPRSLSRPADIYLPYWSRGKAAAFDISVILPVQTLTVEEAAVTQGHALAVREQQKRGYHNNACREAGIHFIPLAVETFGVWSQEAAATIRQFGKLQAFRLGLLPSHCISRLFQRLSLALWRGNAWCLASRNPSFAPSVDEVL